MALKKNDLKNMNKETLDKNLTELRKELMKLRSQVSRGTPPENPGKIRSIKRDIAKILTVTHNKQEGGAKKN